MKRVLFVFLFIFSCKLLFSQNYFMNTSNGKTITTCKATISTSDNCLDASNIATYCENESYTVTFYSGSPTTQIRISFTRSSFFVEEDFDSLMIYNGPNRSSPVLANLSGVITNPFSFVSTGGYLTLYFNSDGVFNDWGFDALIGCEVQSCNNNVPAGDDCLNAPQICDLNGYCGTTSGWYTPDKINLGNDFGGAFCGKIENNSWLKFVANTPQAIFDITSSNCLDNTKGIEAQIFKTTNCNTFTSFSSCIAQNLGSGNITLTSNNNLVPGQTYYIMIDGVDKNQCDYSISARSGINSIQLKANNDSICIGQNTTIKVIGAIAGSTYSWSPIANIIGSNTNDSIIANPSITTKYTCIVTQPNSCLSQTEDIFINIFQPPNANAGIDKTLTCTSPTVQLLGSSTSSNVSFSWTGPGIISGGNTASPTVNAIGKYILTVTDIKVGCTNTDEVEVFSNIIVPNNNAGNDSTLTCTNTTIKLKGSSTTPGVSYSWTGIGIVSGANTSTPSVKHCRHLLSNSYTN
jgi:hypothetical protein